VTSRSNNREWILWIAALAALALVAGVVGSRAFRTVPLPAEVRLDIALPLVAGASAFAISPDGTRIVFRGERLLLWVRSLDSTTATPLEGTEGATRPFWSGDSQSIGFFTQGKLRRIAAEGGPARDLANTRVARGGTWNQDDVILFVSSTNSPVMKVPAGGGEPSPVTALAPGHSGHYAPQFLPDGRHFLFYVIGSPDVNGVHLGDLESSETRQLLKTDSAAVYASSTLLYLRQDELVAQAFDLNRLATTGPAVVVASGVAGRADAPAISAAPAGPIVFRAGRGDGRGSSQFTWFDRSGKELAKVGEPASEYGTAPALSPDGRHVAYLRVLSPGEGDIWLLETNRGVFSRFTFEKGDDVTPVWSPDGERLVFGSNRRGAGVMDLYEKRTAGAAGSEQLLLSSDHSKSATDWSRDGSSLLFSSVDPKTDSDIWALNMDGGKKPFPVVQTGFQEGGAQFSPDGQWITYQSNKSGRPEIYLQPFPGPGADVPVSTNGGTQPRWRRDGLEIFYLAPDGRMMAVSIRPKPAGHTLELDPPVALFDANSADYMVAPDGQRFLLYVTTPAPLTSPLSVILNWKPAF
jgi:Tol biopolymer transport system component